MPDLFPWCLSSPYTTEIHRNLKERELCGRKIKYQSPQLEYRLKMVNWIKSISEKLKLSNASVHLGIFLLDKFMDNHNIMSSRLAPISLICLILAAKYEEHEFNTPTLSYLASLLNFAVTPEDLKHLEAFVLQSFSWRVSWPTVAHFAEFYSMFAVVQGDTDPAKKDSKHLKDIVKATMRNFIDLSLSEVLMLNFLSSEVAAACLLAARLDHGVRPAWPKTVSVITGYSVLDLQKCLNLLIDTDLDHSHKRKLEETNESGYDSSSSGECKLFT